MQAENLGALSDAIAKLVGGYGRTPSNATTCMLDDGLVVTALEDFMTPAEEELVARGQSELVQRLRHGFGEAITDEYVRAAEDTLGRKVLAHYSTVICASSICLEIFILADEQPTHGPSTVPAPQPAWR